MCAAVCLQEEEGTGGCRGERERESKRKSKRERERVGGRERSFLFFLPLTLF